MVRFNLPQNRKDTKHPQVPQKKMQRNTTWIPKQMSQAPGRGSQRALLSPKLLFAKARLGDDSFRPSFLFRTKLFSVVTYFLERRHLKHSKLSCQVLLQRLPPKLYCPFREGMFRYGVHWQRRVVFSAFWRGHNCSMWLHGSDSMVSSTTTFLDLHVGPISIKPR